MPLLEKVIQNKVRFHGERDTVYESEKMNAAKDVLNVVKHKAGVTSKHHNRSKIHQGVDDSKDRKIQGK